MNMKGRLLCIAVAFVVAVSGCSQQDVYSPLDHTDKSITVPIGNRGLTGELKRVLKEHGWRLVVDRGPEVTEASGSRTERFDTFKTRYRLITESRQTDYAMDFSPYLSYELAIIDNQSGQEVFALSGSDSQRQVLTRFKKFVQGK